MTPQKLTQNSTRHLISSYYAAFNAQDVEGLLALLHSGVVHGVSQGEQRVGREAFASFLAHMNACYAETVRDLVVMTSPDGARAAAEFMLDGRYLRTDAGLPEAHGQTYTLQVGAFFEIDAASGLIARVSNHYNMQDWLAQIARPS